MRLKLAAKRGATNDAIVSDDDDDDEDVEEDNEQEEEEEDIDDDALTSEFDAAVEAGASTTRFESIDENQISFGQRRQVGDQRTARSIVCRVSFST